MGRKKSVTVVTLFLFLQVPLLAGFFALPLAKREKLCYTIK